MCRLCATYCWKALNQGYKFTLNLISIGGLHKNLWASKIARIVISRILGLPKTKRHLGVGHVAMHKKYYKGGGGGFPQVQAVVSLVNLCMPVTRLCIKNVITMH